MAAVHCNCSCLQENMLHYISPKTIEKIKGSLNGFAAPSLTNVHVQRQYPSSGQWPCLFLGAIYRPLQGPLRLQAMETHNTCCSLYIQWPWHQWHQKLQSRVRIQSFARFVLPVTADIIGRGHFTIFRARIPRQSKGFRGKTCAENDLCCSPMQPSYWSY